MKAKMCFLACFALLSLLAFPAWADPGGASANGQNTEKIFKAFSDDITVSPFVAGQVSLPAPSLTHAVPVRMHVQNGQDYTMYVSAGQLMRYSGHMPGSYGAYYYQPPNAVPSTYQYQSVYSRDPREAIDRRRADNSDLTDHNSYRTSYTYSYTGPVGNHLRSQVLRE